MVSTNSGLLWRYKNILGAPRWSSSEHASIYCKAEKLDNNRFDVAGSHTDAGKTQVYDDEENRAVSQLEGAIESKTYLEPTLIVVANDQFAKRYYPSGFGQNECHFEYWLGN